MGYADLLIQLKIAYSTEDARIVGETIMASIRRWADDESKSLAEYRGPFPAWSKSTYNKVDESFRNHCRLTVAPTGTISMIADTSSGIEPTFALVWKKQNILDGQSVNYVNKYFEKDAREHGFYSEGLMGYLAEGGTLSDVPEHYKVPIWAKNIYATSPEISPEDHVLMQASFQKHVDSGISKTINFPNSATIEDVEKSYMLAWDKNCKGITVYRAGSREKEVLVKGSKKEGVQMELAFPLSDEPKSDINNIEVDDCCPIPNIIMESGCQTCKNFGWSACVVA